MNLKLEPQRFDELQVLFIREMVKNIKLKLQESGLEGEQLEAATANIAFSVASAIDDTAGIEAEGVEVRPYLTFRTNGDEVIHSGENSFMYEYVYSALRRLFGG